MARENLMSLKAVPLQFAEFKPATFTPAESNLEILNRSMEKIDAREKESIQAKDVMSTTLNEIRSKLNPEEFAKFDEKAQQARDEINTQIELGRYGLAMSTAYSLGRSFADDTELQNKIKTQEAREKAIAEMEQIVQNPLTRRRFKAENPYYYDGTGTWNAQVFKPVPNIIESQFWAEVVNRTPEKSGSKESSSSSVRPTYGSYDGNTYVTGSVSSERSSSIAYSQKNPEDMFAVYEDLMNDPYWGEGMKQNFDDNKWLYDETIKGLTDFSANLYKSGKYNADEIKAIQSSISSLTSSFSSVDVRDNHIKRLKNLGVYDQLKGLINDYNTATNYFKDPKTGIIQIPKDYKLFYDNRANQYFEDVKYRRVNTQSKVGNGITGNNAIPDAKQNKAAIDAQKGGDVGKYVPGNAKSTAGTGTPGQHQSNTPDANDDAPNYD